MQKLKDLTREERILITVQCAPFFLTYKETKQFKSIYAALVKDLKLKSIYKKELWLFITAATSARKSGAFGSQLSLHYEHYVTANRLTKKRISYKRVKELVLLLDEMGYIDLYIGFYEDYTETSARSCFIINDSLLELLDKVNCAMFAPKLPIDSLVEVRDAVTKEPVTKLQALRGIGAKRKLVEDLNRHLQQYNIRLGNVLVSAPYKRVYSGDLSSAGRWYTMNSLQTSPRYMRPSMTIDDLPVTEIDFGAIHPRILYALEGIDKPEEFQPYFVNANVIQGGTEKQKRTLCKLGMMCLLNAKDRVSAMAALAKKYTNNKNTFDGIIMGKGSYVVLFNALEGNNKEISHYFYTERLWARLQAYDAQITESIIKDFMSLNMPILSYHDSYITTFDNSGILMDSMRAGWWAVLGTYASCCFKIEY